MTVDDLIREIAAKHGVAVGRDDPIIILHTINNLLAKEGQIGQQRMLATFKEELETIAHRWGDDAKNKAERILTAALVASKNAMNDAMQEGGKAAAIAVRRELESLTAPITASIREAKRVAYMNTLASGLTFAAAVCGPILWWIVLS